MATNNQGLGEILQMPPKQHHPKMILLITVIVICVAFISYYIYYRVDNSDQTITSTSTAEYSMAQAIQDSLATLRSKDVSPATQSEIQASLGQLSKSKVKPASQSEIDQSLSQLKAQ